MCSAYAAHVSAQGQITVKGQIFNKQYYTLCRVRSITPLLMEGFPSNLNDTFTSYRGYSLGARGGT